MQNETDRQITNIKPEYEVSIGAAYFCLIKERTATQITYEPTVYELDVIKTLGLTRIVAELEVYASGILFDFLNRTMGANIALTAVVLPPHLLNAIAGATTKDGFTFDKTNDVEREFAFGYWGENNDGSLTMIWHPVCKLTPTEETHSTSTAELAEPERSYAVRVIPYNNLWRTRYDNKKDRETGYAPIERGVFFLNPIYQESQVPERKPSTEGDTTNPAPPSNPDTDDDIDYTGDDD